MKHNYYITIIHDLLIGLIIGVLMVGMFFGAALQEQDKLSEMAVMEVEG